MKINFARDLRLPDAFYVEDVVIAVGTTIVAMDRLMSAVGGRVITVDALRRLPLLVGVVVSICFMLEWGYQVIISAFYQARRKDHAMRTKRHRQAFAAMVGLYVVLLPWLTFQLRIPYALWVIVGNLVLYAILVRLRGGDTAAAGDTPNAAV